MTIKCPLCDFENEEGSKFCSNCNIPLVKQDYSEGNPYIKKKWKENDEVVESHIEISESKGTSQSLSSTIRRWDINKENEIKHLHTYKITPEMLFASTIHGLCVFGKDNPKREKIPEFQKAGLDMCNNFERDASLFEVGCYLFFH